MHNYEQLNRHFLPNLTSEEIGGLDREKSIVLLPLASIEQHGPHLPVYTDSLILHEVLARVSNSLPEDFPLWCLPILPYGKSTEHSGFPGTITLTSETLLVVLKEIAYSVSLSGFKRFVILNTHGGNSELVDVAIRDIRASTGLLVFGLHLFLRIAVPSYGLSTDEMTYGIHAGDVETSILLKTCPGLVRLDKAPESIPEQLKKLDAQPFLGPLNFAWLTRDIAKDGVLGNAKTAHPDRGEQYLAAAASETADMLGRILEFSFD